MPKKAVFPGSFDPFTKGHQNLVEKALTLFDEVVIGLGVNSSKQSYYTLESRIRHIESIFQDHPQVSVQAYQKLTTEFCMDIGADFILRGLRDVKDFEYERSIAQMNHAIQPKVETVFLITEATFNHINSTIIRELAKNGGLIDSFVTNSHFLVS